MAIKTYGTTVVETAVTSHDELGFLAIIMADQLDVSRKLVYADWLEERGDSRGSFLREFVRRAPDPTAQLPQGDEFPFSWLQVVGVRPQRLIRENIRGPYATFLEQDLLRRLKPTLHMMVVPAPDTEFLPGTTKFGGLPDLPQGLDWPADPYPEGTLVGVFCAQIRLSDLQNTLVGQELPSNGLVSFFADELKVPVRYFPEDASFVRRGPPGVRDRMKRFGEDFYPLPSGAIKFIEGADFLIRYDEGLWPREVVEETWESLKSIDEMMIPPGFATEHCDVTHHQLMGNGREFNAYPQPDLAPGFCRLATFGSAYNDACYWGDSGQPIFYIAKADLASGRFENARSYVG